MNYLDSIFGSEMEPSLLLCCFYPSLMYLSVWIDIKICFVINALFGSKNHKRDFLVQIETK